MNMKFLLCCTLVPEKYEVEIKEISNAANRFLTNLCSKLSVDNSLKIISYIGINVEPNVKNELIREESEDRKYIFRTKTLIRGIAQMFLSMWKELGECDYAVTYNVVYAWMFVPILAKLKKKKSVLILADYSPTESYINRKQRVYAKVQQYFIGKYDYVIGLSEKTKKYLKPTQKFMCMEGGISESFYNYFNTYKVPEKEKIIVMYSGILEKVTGVDLLIEAFSNLALINTELIITGDGSLSLWITEAAAKYENIKYLGCLPYEEYMDRLMSADILVNPRNMNLHENEYNFPSKIMEYLATGKIIISTKFPGWERFQAYITFCESNCKSLEQEIKRCVSTREKRGEYYYSKNRLFAVRFLWISQVQAIINFLNEND